MNNIRDTLGKYDTHLYKNSLIKNGAIFILSKSRINCL
jgi:hypothetical protein